LKHEYFGGILMLLNGEVLAYGASSSNTVTGSTQVLISQIKLDGLSNARLAG